MRTVNLDEDLEQGDWTKQSWDLPPYKSKEFLAQTPDLDHFRTTFTYRNAVANGLILDDEWVGPVEPEEDPIDQTQVKTRDRKGRFIHIHIK